MKRPRRILFWMILAVSVLTVSALADSGPKPLLTVRVENAPEEGYYLDLLAEGDYNGDMGDGIDWSYTDEEAAALDQTLLEALRSAVPEGYHACTAQGTGGPPMWGDLAGTPTGREGERLHTFSYVGVPKDYRILMVTAGGDTYVFPPCTRSVLQSSVTVDWADKSVTVPPVWVGYVLQFFSTLLPTLVIEGVLLVLFGFGRSRRNWRAFLLVNLITQGLLAAWLSVTAMESGISWWYLFLFIPAEVVIALAEGGLYTRLLTGRSRVRAFLYGLTANACSAAAGFLIAVPVWQFIVSIS